MRVLCFGGRKFADAALVAYHFDLFQALYGRITEVIHGDAEGADRLCAMEAWRRGILHRPFPALWHDISVPGAVVRYRRNGTPYNALAGPQRNVRMLVQSKPDWGMGFEGGTGTADMALKLKLARIPVHDAGCIGF